MRLFLLVQHVGARGGILLSVLTFIMARPAVAAGPPAFVDRFADNTNGWAIGEDAKRTLAIEDGAYRITHKRTSGAWATWTSVPATARGDFVIVARMEKRFGVDDHGYGVVFGAKDDGDKHTFVVSGDGHFRYGVMRRGVFENVTGWQPSKAIRQGDGRPNTLEVAKVNEQLRLAINGERVADLEAKPFAGDRVGFEVNHLLSVAVDELTVFVDGGPGAETADGSRVVAVFDIVDGSGKTSDSMCGELTEYLIARLAQREGFAVVPRARLREDLRKSKATSYELCYDQSCQIELGKAAAANAIVTTRLMRVGDTCVVAATLFDLARETTEHAAVAERPSCSPPELLSALKQIAGDL